MDDGVNVNIEEEFIDWGVWEQKINLKLSTGDDMDMFPVMGDVVSLANYLGRGAIKDIGLDIDKFGPNLKENIPDWEWNSVQKNGKTYAIPAHWQEPANSVASGIFTVNHILLDKAGVTRMPKTQEELLAAMEKVMMTQTDASKPYLPINGGLRDPSFALHRTYDSYPFIVKDKVAYITNDGQVKNWAETEEFKKRRCVLPFGLSEKIDKP